MICGITTAPRQERYLSRTLASLSRGGFDSPVMFEDADKRGVFWNWSRALGSLAQNGAGRILLCQDDILVCRGLRAFCEAYEGLDGVLSLYTSAKNAGEPGIVPMTRRDNPWGACAYLFSRDAAVRILELAPEWASRQRVEHFVTESCERLGLVFAVVRPSLVQHIGDCRTDGTRGRAAGYLAAADFVGDGFDATSLLTAQSSLTAPAALSGGRPSA